MADRLTGKAAIVTGGGGMIGAAIARRFAAEGAAVTVSDVVEEAGRKVAAALEQAGGRARFFAADAADDAQVAALVAGTAEAFGGVDVLVNCAYSQEFGNAEELSEAGWHRSIDAMLKSTWLCARHAVPAMRARGGGAIVNLSSIQAFMPYPRRVAYAAAKGGVSALTIELALDYGPDGIRVNAICPGVVQSAERLAALDDRMRAEMAFRARCYPVGRIGVPDDIAAAALYLASDEAGFVTGVNLVVDGGVTLQSAERLVVPHVYEDWREDPLGREAT